MAVGRRERAPRRSCRAAGEAAGRRGERAGGGGVSRGCLRIAAPLGARTSLSDWTQTGARPGWARPHRRRAEPLGQPSPDRVAVRLRARLRVPPPPPPPPPTPPGAALRTRGALFFGGGGRNGTVAHALLWPRLCARAAGAALSVSSAIAACAPGGVCVLSVAPAATASLRPKQWVRGGLVVPAGAFARDAECGVCVCLEPGALSAEAQLRAAAARGKTAGCYLLS